MNIPRIPEQFLRQVWQQQRFIAHNLHTSNGKPVQIISPGTPNNDSGPDFLNASIQIGGITFYGDVELHQDAAGWQAHKHASDPHYNRVILHVVMTADNVSRPARTQSDRPLPLLVLHPFLDDTQLAPGESFEYTSFCPLTTSFGTMHGTFEMVTGEGQVFDAEIAPFALGDPLTIN